jgi:hypothetical protein
MSGCKNFGGCKYFQNEFIATAHDNKQRGLIGGLDGCGIERTRGRSHRHVAAVRVSSSTFWLVRGRSGHLHCRCLVAAPPLGSRPVPGRSYEFSTLPAVSPSANFRSADSLKAKLCYVIHRS